MSRHRFTNEESVESTNRSTCSLGGDVAVGVRVELDVEAVLVEDPAAELVGAGRQCLPLVVGQRPVLDVRTGLVVAVEVWDHHDVLATDGLGQRRDVGDLLPRRVPGVGPVQGGEDGAGQTRQGVLVQLVLQLEGSLGR